jgi:hypothetical protein
MTAAAAQTHANDAVFHNVTTAAQVRSTSPSDIVTEYLIGKHNMTTVYASPDPYFEAFEEIIDLQKFDLAKHRTTGLCLAHSNNCLFLGSMAPGTPGAVDPLVSGFGQTVSYHSHIHANTVRSSHEQHRSPHNL